MYETFNKYFSTLTIDYSTITNQYQTEYEKKFRHIHDQSAEALETSRMNT